MHKIAQILLSPRVGGAETLAASLEQEWEAMEVHSHIIYLDPDGDHLGRVRRLRQLRRALNDFAPDAVVAHSYLPALYARVAWGSRGPVHSVLHSASDDFASTSSRFIERTLSSRTASVIAVSATQEAQYRARFPNVRITRIANGVRRDVRARESFAPRPRRVVTVARVAAQKRPEFWNAVAREMYRRRPELQFEWWGPLSGQDSLDSLVRSPTPAARHMGPTEDLSEVLAGADLMFHPSGREAHSIVLLEAAVSGLPVVYSDSIERPDQDSTWSLRYNANDPSDACDALEDVMNRWPEVAGRSVSSAPEARVIYGMTPTADRYLHWLRSPA